MHLSFSFATDFKKITMITIKLRLNYEDTIITYYFTYQLTTGKQKTTYLSRKPAAANSSY